MWPTMPKPNPKSSPKRTPDWRPATAQLICRLADMPEDKARGFTLNGPDGERLEVIIWRDEQGIRGFVNQCPHLGLPLETFPDRFLSADGTHLICSAHGAQFDAQGGCFAGPCKGDALTRLPLEIDDKHIVLAASAAHSED